MGLLPCVFETCVLVWRMYRVQPYRRFHFQHYRSSDPILLTGDQVLFLVCAFIGTIVLACIISCSVEEQRQIIQTEKVLAWDKLHETLKDEFSTSMSDRIVNVLIGTHIRADEVKPLLTAVWMRDVTDTRKIQERINAIDTICSTIGNSNNQRTKWAGFHSVKREMQIKHMKPLEDWNMWSLLGVFLKCVL